MISKQNLKYGLKTHEGYNKYFNFPAVFSLILIMPLSIISVSALLKIAGYPHSFEFLSKMGRPPYFFFPVYICSLIALITCFTDIIFINAGKESAGSEVSFTIRKSLFNLVIILVCLAYTAFIFLFVEFDRLWDIPIGRN